MNNILQLNIEDIDKCIVIVTERIEVIERDLLYQKALYNFLIEYKSKLIDK